MKLTEREFLATTRTMAMGAVAACQCKGMARDDAANVIGVALTEALGALMGPADAIERLRDLADLAERQLMEAMH